VTTAWKPRKLIAPRGALFLRNWLYRKVLSIDADPRKTVTWVGVSPGMDVLELGPGPGYYTPAIAQAAAPGTVHCIDVQREMLDLVDRVAAAKGLANVKTYKADAAVLPLADASIDLVWALYVLEEVPDLDGTVQEFARVLRPGGEVVVAQVKYDFDRAQKLALQETFPRYSFEKLEEVDTWWRYKARFRKQA